MKRLDAAEDRRTDIVAVRPNPLRIDFFKNNGTSFENAVEWRSEPYDYSAYLFRCGRLQTQGKIGIIAIQRNPLRVVTWRNCGNVLSCGCEELTEPYDYSGHLFFAADIDGNRNTDLIAIWPDPFRIITWRNNGSSFDPGREWLTEPYDYSDYRFFAEDIDGDGRADIIAVQKNPLRIVTWRNNGSSFDPGREWLAEPYNYGGYLFFAGDLDSDGKADILAVQPNPLRIVTWRNNAGAFDSGQESRRESNNYNGHLLSVCDADGDGRTDLIAVRGDLARMVIWRNNGASFDAGRDWSPAEINSLPPGLLDTPTLDPITMLMMPAASVHVR